MFKTRSDFFWKTIILYIMVIASIGCDFSQATRLELPIDSRHLQQLAFYYKETNSNLTGVKLTEEYIKNAVPFNAQEVEIPVKGENFLSPYIAKGVKYFELGYFKYEGGIYKIIIYNKIGESDTLLLNVQLNSYDANGILTDALLLSSFFSYEDISRFSYFIISSDHEILINNYVIVRCEEGDEGISERCINKLIPQIYLTEKYKITNGKFNVISTSKVNYIIR
ncbi:MULTISPECIES: hypothetical protein [Enterobacterales]|uniref:hypothetical protein n=1 Tax=Enterobacterales TaxID=91347 RepID=UPI002EDAD988